MYEKLSTRKNIPFYVLFISCPYNTYDLNQMSKKTILEFHDWSSINKILEKLVKFYIGDVNLKEIDKEDNGQNNKTDNNDIRDKVKDIMQRVLGSSSKISQLQNGVKGNKISKSHF